MVTGNVDRVFVVAMACEAEAITRQMVSAAHSDYFGRAVTRGKLPNGYTAVVIEGGIGKSNAAAATQLAISTLGAKTVYNLGLAGGIQDAIKPLTCYTITETVQYDFNLANLNGTGLGVLDEFNTPFLSLEPWPGFPTAVCATGDAFSDDEQDALFLAKTFGAGVRDMELGAIAQVCLRADVQCVAIKAVTDVVGQDIPMTEQYRKNREQGLELLSQAAIRL